MRVTRRLLSFVVLIAACTVCRVEGQAVSAEAERGARAGLQEFIDAWNTADNDKLRAAMHFPFISLFPGGTAVAATPADFSTDFEGMRARNDWASSSFDFATLRVLAASDDKVHCTVEFERTNDADETYLRGRVFYVLTRRDGAWKLQMRTSFADTDASEEASANAVTGARRAVLDFFEAFNAGDVTGVTGPINYPHVFLAGGGVGVAPDASSGSVRPDFDRMRQEQGWHVSTIDSLEPSYSSQNKVHFDLVFSRWHSDGTRYRTIPALWILTRVDGHWGIQLRSLMPATFTASR